MRPQGHGVQVEAALQGKEAVERTYWNFSGVQVTGMAPILEAIESMGLQESIPLNCLVAVLLLGKLVVEGLVTLSLRRSTKCRWHLTRCCCLGESGYFPLFIHKN